MILEILQRYADIVIDYEISGFRLAGESYQLIARIELTGSSLLFVKDYLIP